MRPADAVRIRWECLGLAVFLVLSGCAMPDLSGSASMRVEVEVYKGPLSKEPMAQWADLIGLFQEAETALIGINHVTVAFAVNQGIVNFPIDSLASPKNTLVAARKKDADDPSDPQKNTLDDAGQKIAKDREPNVIHRGIFYDAYDTKYEDWCKVGDPSGWISQIDFFNCHMLVSLFADAKELFHEVQGIRCLADAVNRQVVPVSSNAEALMRDLCVNSEKSPIKLTAGRKTNVRAVLVEITRVAAHFRAKSFRMAEAMVAGQTTTAKIRIAMTNLIAHVADLGNQMQSQADTLLKQVDGQDRRELPLSAYLRDAEPTDFVQLYDWHDATAHDASLLAPFFIPGTKVSQVKAYKRLYADHHWAKINTVYASGRGEVSMALIKDDVGNWNLKAFDNDPEELLNAYRDVATAALDKAMELAAKSATGGQSEAVDILLGVANKAAFGGGPKTDPANIGGVSLNALHQLTDKKLLEVASEFAEADKRKIAAYGAAKKMVDETNKKIEAAKATLKSMPKPSLDAEPSPDPEQKETEPKGPEKALDKQEMALQKAREDLIEHRNAALARFGEVLRNYGETVDLLTEAAATE